MFGLDLFLPFFDSSTGTSNIDWALVKTSGIVSAFFNIAAALLLIYALSTTFTEAKKFRRTFGIDEKFLKFFFYGSLCMLINSSVFWIKSVFFPDGGERDPWLIAMFSVFLIANPFGVYVNYFSLKIKKDSVKKATELGISEQEYWEKYIQPTLGQ